jgi:hypothetical protein
MPVAPPRPVVEAGTGAAPRISIEVGRIEIRQAARPAPAPAARAVPPRDHVIDPQLPWRGRTRGA